LIRLTEEQRTRLAQLYDQAGHGSHFAINIVRLLDSGKDAAYVAKVSFCSSEEVQRVVQALEAGGIEAVVNYQPDDHA